MRLGHMTSRTILDKRGKETLKIIFSLKCVNKLSLQRANWIICLAIPYLPMALYFSWENYIRLKNLAFGLWPDSFPVPHVFYQRASF